MKNASKNSHVNIFLCDVQYFLRTLELRDLLFRLKVIDKQIYGCICLSETPKEFYEIQIKESSLIKWNSGECSFDDLSFGHMLLVDQSSKGYHSSFVQLLRARGRTKLVQAIIDEFNDSLNSAKYNSYSVSSQSWICPHQGFIIKNSRKNNINSLESEKIIVLAMDGTFAAKQENVL